MDFGMVNSGNYQVNYSAPTSPGVVHVPQQTNGQNQVSASGCTPDGNTDAYGATLGFTLSDLANPQAAAAQPPQYQVNLVCEPMQAPGSFVQPMVTQPTLANAQAFFAPPSVSLAGFPGTAAVNYMMPDMWSGTSIAPTPTPVQGTYAPPTYTYPASPTPDPTTGKIVEQYQKLHDLQMQQGDVRDALFDKRDQLGDLKISRMNTPYADLGKVQASIDGVVDGIISDRNNLLNLTFQTMDVGVEIASLQQNREEEESEDDGSGI